MPFVEGVCDLPYVGACSCSKLISSSSCDSPNPSPGTQPVFVIIASLVGFAANVGVAALVGASGLVDESALVGISGLVGVSAFVGVSQLVAVAELVRVAALIVAAAAERPLGRPSALR